MNTVSATALPWIGSSINIKSQPTDSAASPTIPTAATTRNTSSASSAKSSPSAWKPWRSSNHFRPSACQNKMHPARIAELLQPFLSPIPNPCHSERPHREESAVLSPSQLQHISTYIDILLHWNARINLTAIRDPEE